MLTNTKKMPKNAKKTPKLQARDRAKEETKDIFSQRLSDLLLKGSETFIMTGKDLAVKANISEGIISGYRKGDNAPALDKLKRIAIALNVTTDYLLGITDAPTHPEEDIAKRTGLTPPAVSALLEWQNAKGQSQYDEKEARTKIKALSYLIERERKKSVPVIDANVGESYVAFNKGFLGALYDYLFTRYYVPVEGWDEETTKEKLNNWEKTGVHDLSDWDKVSRYPVVITDDGTKKEVNYFDGNRLSRVYRADVDEEISALKKIAEQEIIQEYHKWIERKKQEATNGEHNQTDK